MGQPGPGSCLFLSFILGLVLVQAERCSGRSVCTMRREIEYRVSNW